MAGSGAAGASCAWSASAPRARLERRRLGRPGRRARGSPPPSGRCSFGIGAAAAPTRPTREAFARRAAGSAPDGHGARRSTGARERAELTDESRRLLTILQTTTLLALLAAAFTLATAIGGRVLAQRRQIGLLRAIGMTPARRHRPARRPLPRAGRRSPPRSASPAGALLARAAVGRRRRRARRARAPARRASRCSPARSLVALLVVAAATALPAWRAGRHPGPGRRSRSGAARRSARASRVARLARRLRLPVVVGVGAKDAFAQRGRTVLTVASLALAAALVATAMGFEATMDRLGARPGAARAALRPARSESSLPAAEVDRLLARRGEVAAVARVREIVHDRPRPAPRSTARVLDGPLAGVPLRDPRRPRRPRARRGDARAAARSTRSTRGIGERVTLRVGGQPVTLRVVGRHVEPDDEGRGAVTEPARACPRRGREARRALLGRAASSPGADPRATAAALTPRRSAAGSSVERPIESLEREAADMRPVVYGTVALLLVIAALNLLTTLGLAVRERERDYAVLASVGATPRQVRTTVIAGGAALALPAALVGLPLGAWLFMLMIGVDRPRRRRRCAARSRPGGGTRSRSSARSCWPPRSARWPRAPRRASGPRPRLRAE